MTRIKMAPVTTKIANSAIAYPIRPYRKFPTIKRADQIVAHPVDHPSSERGMFSFCAQAAACASEMPA